MLVPDAPQYDNTGDGEASQETIVGGWITGWLRMGARGTVQWIVAILMVSLCAAAVHAVDLPVYVYSADFDYRIPADPDTSKGFMADAHIDIPGHFTVCDLDVGINLTHSNVWDIEIILQSPAGTSLCLNMYSLDEYFVGEDYRDAVFDDEAEIAVEDARPPFTGSFKPRSPAKLSLFDGEDAFGRWTLRVYDAHYYDTGTFEELELMITTPEPASAVLLMLGAVLVTLTKRAERR